MEPTWYDEKIPNDSLNEEDPNCEVKKILADKKKEDDMYYLIQWVGYPVSQNQWVARKDLECPKILAAYRAEKKEKNLLLKKFHEEPREKVLSASKDNGKVKFNIIDKNGKNKVCTTDEMKRKHAKALLDFYEAHINFTDKQIYNSIQNRPMYAN